MLNKPGILFVVRPTAGGIARHVVTLVNGIKDYFNVTVACAGEGSPAQELRAAGVTILPLPLSGSISPAKDFYSFCLLTRYMMKHKTIIMQAPGAKAALLARPAARMAGVPVSVYTAHNSVICETRPAWKKVLIKAMERLLLGSTDRIITVSHALGEEMAEKMKICRQKIITIPNGIAFKHLEHMPDPVQAKKKWNIPEHRVVVGTEARMAPQKGLEFFVRAAGILVHKYKRDLHFIIAGDGPLKDNICRQIHETGLQNNFTLTGMVQEIAQVYCVLDIFVLPSLTEGLPLSLLEAMSCSLPVVATSTGGVTEVIQNNVDGLLVPPGRPEDMAAAIAHLIENPRDAERIGSKAHLKILDRFHSSQMVEKTSELYRYLLEEKGLSLAGNELILAPK